MLSINRSLLTLTAVISKLSEKASQWIPYRDSKLTRYLENALQGNAKISIVCSISPGDSSYEQSQSTLNFAAMAKKIKQTVQKNETTENDKTMIITRLEGEIRTLKERLRVLEGRGVVKEQEKNDVEMTRVKDKLVKLVSKIATGISKPAEESKLSESSAWLDENAENKEKAAKGHSKLSQCNNAEDLNKASNSASGKPPIPLNNDRKKAKEAAEKIQNDDFLEDELQVPDYLNSNIVRMPSKGSINPELTAILHEAEEAFVGETIANLRKQLIECDLDRQRLRKENRECIVAVSEMTSLLETVLTELKGYRRKYGKLYSD
eukprot:TRINITY_DN7151_c0_g3_i1.p1 TRINITY_DN7151_c0_g3~~TRINITY_DN7151_c0_g3_i1.p1  ORF type:complete len:321 (-),score=100.69 TRINITY_DN7151_c0_g3_i1:144-1106(-)